MVFSIGEYNATLVFCNFMPGKNVVATGTGDSGVAVGLLCDLGHSIDVSVKSWCGRDIYIMQNMEGQM